MILSRASSPGNAAWALMHDAAEAYITDIPYPIKAAGLVPGIVDAEKQIMRVICERFGLDPVEPAEVKELDMEILDLEADAFLVRHPDWPKGTPRQPRDGLVFVWQKCRTPLFKPGVSFMMKAVSLGLTTHEDLDRYVQLAR